MRVETPADVTIETFAELLARRNNLGYTLKGRIMRGEFGFAFSASEGPRPIGGQSSGIGVRLHSPDERYVAQLSVEGFTLSRLQPYESWEALVGEARRLWQDYSECLNPPRIIRVATRYINNLRLPPTPGLQSFLNLLPVLPVGLPGALSGFLQRYVLSGADSEATIILTQALEVSSLERPLPVILDIDAFRVAPFPSDGPAVWAYLSRLRSLKNRTFFACLTDAGVALYL